MQSERQVAKYNAMTHKQFWGDNSEDEARSDWGEKLDSGIHTTKEIGVVKDSARWPQETSHYEIVHRRT